ncbi:MAG: DUF433 domain-containing protein [Calditrichaeota bacterium]|nr:MAG: DUF433 domain-containing protein [Calditrichota bacterium]
MQLEDYFDFLAPNDIRLKGHRIGIESILYEYIHNAKSPEEICECFPTLRLDQIYATILYYLLHRDEMDRYMKEWLEHGERMREKQRLHPPPVVEKLRKIHSEQISLEELVEKEKE